MRGHSTHLGMEGNDGRGLATRDCFYRERWRHRNSNPPPDIGERDWIVALQSARLSSALTLRQS
jgi:hypothetical protein